MILTEKYIFPKDEFDFYFLHRYGVLARARKYKTKLSYHEFKKQWYNEIDNLITKDYEILIKRNYNHPYSYVEVRLSIYKIILRYIKRVNHSYKKFGRKYYKSNEKYAEFENHLLSYIIGSARVGKK